MSQFLNDMDELAFTHFKQNMYSTTYTHLVNGLENVTNKKFKHALQWDHWTYIEIGIETNNLE